MLFLSFPREGDQIAPYKGTIEYLGCRDSATTRTTEGARMTDRLVLQTWKPSENYFEL